jgi:hypothetical protein
VKIAVTANGQDLDAPTSPVFGRCPTYILVDVETMQFEAVANPALSAPGGAGIQAAQFVRQALEAYKAGELRAIGGPSGPAHAGMGRGGGRRRTR